MIQRSSRHGRSSRSNNQNRESAVPSESVAADMSWRCHTAPGVTPLIYGGTRCMTLRRRARTRISRRGCQASHHRFSCELAMSCDASVATEVLDEPVFVAEHEPQSVGEDAKPVIIGFL